MDFSISNFTQLSQASQFKFQKKTYYISLSEDRFVLSNRTDLDEMSHSRSSRFAKVPVSWFRADNRVETNYLKKGSLNQNLIWDYLIGFYIKISIVFKSQLPLLW